MRQGFKREGKTKALLREGNKKDVVRLLRQVERWELRGGNAPDYVTPVTSSSTTALVDLTKDVKQVLSLLLQNLEFEMTSLCRFLR